MITANLDHSRFNAALDAIRDALIGSGQDVKNLLVDEHRRLTRLIVNLTPPPKHLGGQELGEGSVKRDLYSLISEADENTLKPIMDKYGVRNIDTYMTSQSSGERIHLEWENIALGSTQLAELHNSYRNNRGTIDRRKTVLGSWKSRIVVVKGLRDEYVASVQAHVGRMKAKWAYCASLLGERFPPFISRHFSSVSSASVSDVNLTGNNPGITFGGSGRGFGRTRAVVNDAANIRSKQIANRVRLVLSGYAKDVAQGIRPRPHASETATEPTEDME